MIINSPLSITHYAGQTPLSLTGQGVGLDSDQLIDFNKLLQSVSTIYASQSGTNGPIPTFWTRLSGVQNGIKIYQPDSNSTLTSLEPRSSYYFIMRDSTTFPLSIPAAGGPLEGFIDDIINLPSIRITSVTSSVSNPVVQDPSATIGTPVEAPAPVQPPTSDEAPAPLDNQNNNPIVAQAIIPNSFNENNNIYSFNINVSGLQSYKNYTYTVDIVDAEWPTYFIGQPSGTLTAEKNVLNTIENISSITNRLVFCVSGVCDSYPEILNEYTLPNYPTLWRSSVDYRVIMRASIKCNDCLNDNIVYSDYIILKYTTSNSNTTPSLPDVSFKITE